jgi:uncharacterized protein
MIKQQSSSVQSNNKIKLISKQLEQYFSDSKFKNKVQYINLFGSVAKGKDTKNSDIDLIVHFDEKSQITLIDLSQLKFELSDFLGQSVDLITEEGIKKHLRSKILNSSYNVYKKY